MANFPIARTIPALLLLLASLGIMPSDARTNSGSNAAIGTGNSIGHSLGQPPAAKNLLENALLQLARLNEPTAPTSEHPVPCTCGIFLSGQFDKASASQPRGNAALLYEQDVQLPCNGPGNKQCTNRCLEMVSVRPSVRPLRTECAFVRSRARRSSSTCRIRRTSFAAPSIATATGNAHICSYRTATARG